MKLKNNRETLKLELHFEKSEYLKMTDTQKSKLKSAYLWSNKTGAWVSRTKYPNHWNAKRIAQELGATGEIENVGDKLSYAERLENQAERAESRAERYEQYSANAEKRAKGLQSDFNKMRSDIAWLTQPIIAGHSGSRAFANHRNKVMARYERGFDEYSKSAYYQDRAATARATADNAKLKDAGYLDKRIREATSIIKKIQSYIIQYEEKLYKIQQGETITNYSGDVITAERIENAIQEKLQRYEFEQDKIDFFQNCLDELGGVRFSQENIKAGYIVKIRGDAEKVTRANPLKVVIKSSCGLVLDYLYSEIQEIIAATEEKPKTETKAQPFKTDEILTKNRMGDDSVYKAFQIVAHTDKTIKIQEIAVINGVPQAYKFINDKPAIRKPNINQYGNDWVIYDGGWQLCRYNKAH